MELALQWSEEMLEVGVQPYQYLIFFSMAAAPSMLGTLSAGARLALLSPSLRFSFREAVSRSRCKHAQLQAKGRDLYINRMLCLVFSTNGRAIEPRGRVTIGPDTRAMHIRLRDARLPHAYMVGLQTLSPVQGSAIVDMKTNIAIY